MTGREARAVGSEPGRGGGGGPWGVSAEAEGGAVSEAMWRAVQQGGELQELVSEQEFARFQALIHREAGIWLASNKRALLAGRLARRVRELGLPSFRAYRELVERDDAERVRMLDRITTNETHFFREPRHFEFLAGEVFPRWRAEAAEGLRPRRARIWSAACSTGEEPYSIAMSLLRAFPPGSGWELEVLATDLSTRVLQQAEDAVWPIDKAVEIPEAARRAFMLRGTGPHAGIMKAGPELRALVRFQRLNLNERAYPDIGVFDAVFCRNVFIYFDGRTKDAVTGRLLERLEPSGYLFLGHAESLSGSLHPVRGVMPTVYVHERAAPGRGPS